LVYWPSPVSNGRGGFTWGEAVEIKGRWEGRSEVFLDQDGREIRSQAVAYVDQDVDLGGYLYLGALDNLDPDHSDPTLIEGAWEIRSFKKVTALKELSGGFPMVRKAWL
ncbi:MAG: hypothetical protein AB1896_18420, partial [Thermodesulfobacteriota bacterium]